MSAERVGDIIMCLSSFQWVFLFILCACVPVCVYLFAGVSVYL